MTKGDKLVRSLRQLFEFNRYKIRDKVGACAIARHLQCFILTKTWVDGSDLQDETNAPQTRQQETNQGAEDKEDKEDKEGSDVEM